jgi:hypothetical protein
MDSLTKGLYYISDTTINDFVRYDRRTGKVIKYPNGISEEDKIKIQDNLMTIHKNLSEPEKERYSFRCTNYRGVEKYIGDLSDYKRIQSFFSKKI